MYNTIMLAAASLTTLVGAKRAADPPDDFDQVIPITASTVETVGMDDETCDVIVELAAVFVDAGATLTNGIDLATYYWLGLMLTDQEGDDGDYFVHTPAAVAVELGQVRGCFSGVTP